MHASMTPDQKLTLQLDREEADAFRKSVKVAVAALVTLYGRAGMTEAHNCFTQIDKALENAVKR